MEYDPPNFAASHRAQSLAWRACVGIVLFNNEQQVFMGKRIAGDLPASVQRWQLPQGGIDHGETPYRAAKRELAEETGITQTALIYELAGWLSYDLPEVLIGKALQGKYRGQSQKWFAMRFTGHDRDIDLAAHDQIEFEDWAWISLEKCPSLVVPFKRPIYEILASKLQLLLQDN